MVQLKLPGKKKTEELILVMIATHNYHFYVESYQNSKTIADFPPVGEPSSVPDRVHVVNGP